MGRPLRLVFRSRTDAEAPEPLEPVDELPPEIEFVAYAEDCILSGHVRLSADRLSDLVNDHEELQLVDVLVADLAGGEGFDVHELLVKRDEILIVHATGPRGRPERRQRTRQHPIVARLGPYEVRGYIHALPGADPIAGLRRRQAVVALTDAVIAYTVGGESVRRRVNTVLINHELADSIAEGSDEEDEFAGLEFPVDTSGVLVKDFTGDVLGRIPIAVEHQPLKPATAPDDAATASHDGLPFEDAAGAA